MVRLPPIPKSLKSWIIQKPCVLLAKQTHSILYPIIIPCHRVIGANQTLTGYAGGIEKKRWLLKHEGALLL
ncbi:MAG: MGMT family protein [Balneolaceae bacterium]|nr:MGMT family protein [Balneolaceae bacterium]